jgi:hypothetical protein
MIANLKRIILIIISALFFFSFSVITKAEDVAWFLPYYETYLAPIVVANMNENRRLKNTPLCKNFSTNGDVNSLAFQAYIYYTYNSKTMLESIGQSNSCGKMNFREDLYNRNNSEFKLEFNKKEKRFNGAINTYIESCFVNGDVLQNKIQKAAHQTAKIIPCSHFSILSKKLTEIISSF